MASAILILTFGSCPGNFDAGPRVNCQASPLLLWYKSRSRAARFLFTIATSVDLSQAAHLRWWSPAFQFLGLLPG